ncbi:hypothetical protein [Micromonospora zamorensis]|uniref:hypothetical protein n=1 Tax=Micromonospora zamorensis TaxID=709883 RepID=UPI0037BDE377
MNRYIIDGLLADMRAGRRVVVLSGTRTELRNTFVEVAAHATEKERVRRRNGEERISVADGLGWITFGLSGNPPRGFDADVVLFDAHRPSWEAVDAARPLIAGTQGELIT